MRFLHRLGPCSLRSLLRFAVASALVASALVASEARAGCFLECTEITANPLRVEPALPCLEEQQVDDNACVCSSQRVLVNRCDASLSVTLAEGASCSDPSGCEARSVPPGETFTLEQRIDPRQDGEPYSDEVSTAYSVTITEGSATGDYTLTIGAVADIDPGASGCAVGHVGAASPTGLGAMGAGLALLGLARRRRSARLG